MRYRVRIYSAPEWIRQRSLNCTLTHIALREWAMGEQDTPELVSTIARAALNRCDLLMEELKRVESTKPRKYIIPESIHES